MTWHTACCLPRISKSLSKLDNVSIVEGPGGEIRYSVFDSNTNPFSYATADADPAKALAVRQAIADLVDREAIATDVYKGTYTPLYSYIPGGVEGSTTDFKDKYGEGKGGPSVEGDEASCRRRRANSRPDFLAVQPRSLIVLG